MFDTFLAKDEEAAEKCPSAPRFAVLPSFFPVSSTGRPFVAYI